MSAVQKLFHLVAFKWIPYKAKIQHKLTCDNNNNNDDDDDDDDDGGGDDDDDDDNSNNVVIMLIPNTKTNFREYGYWRHT
mgnify:CR=1 FL=1